MRIALKPVSADSSPSDIATPKSSGGSFLDILTQGTQGAVQPAKDSGSQAQSDAHSSSQDTPDDATSKESSAHTTPSASTAVASSQSQTVSTPNSTTAQQNPPAGPTQTSSAQNLTSLAALLSLTAAGDKISTSVAGQPDESASQIGPSGKQASSTKGSQSKQATPASSAGQLTGLQQALLAQQTITIPQAITAAQQVFAGSTRTQSQDPESTSAISAGADLASDAGGQVVARQAAQQMTTAETSATQPQTGADASTGAIAGSRFQQDFADAAAFSAKSPAAASSDAGATGQASSQKTAGAAAPTTPLQTTPNALSAFFATPASPNDTVPSQSSAKVIPFKVNLPGTATNATSSAPSTAGTANASTVSSASTAQTRGNGSSNSSSSDGQSGSDASAKTPTDNSTATTAAFRLTDATVAQTGAFGATTLHPATTSSTTSSASDGSSAHVEEGHGLPTQAASLPATSTAINSARVIQSMNETEMRVGMRSTEFGDISIRTMVTQQQMQAQISVDHSELVSALAAHIPAAQAKLGNDFGLHASIEVSQGGASFSGNQGQSSQRDYKPVTPFAQIDGGTPAAEPDRTVVRSANAGVADDVRLDIRA